MSVRQLFSGNQIIGLTVKSVAGMSPEKEKNE